MIPNALPKSLIDNPRLQRWISFADGRVKVRSGKVELGQGVLTALVQIAAEELDVSPERIDLHSGGTAAGPNEGFTAGSSSIEVGGAALRILTAEVRALFLDGASKRLGCDPGELTIADGAIARDGKNSGLDYWNLAPDIDLARDVTGAAPVKRAEEYKLVGRSLPRIDLAEKLAGGGFIHDMALPGMLHARVIRQPWRGAELGPLEAESLALKPGVKVVRDGNFLAVLAPDEWDAVRAAAKLAALAKWSGGEPVPDNADTVEWLQSLPVDPRETGNDLERGERRGTNRLRAEYGRSYLAHGSIAPSCALAQEESGTLKVYTHSQGIFFLRASIATALKREPGTIELQHHHGAGCYGHNGADDAAFDAALLAGHVEGRPVRVLWSRADELSSAPLGTAMAMRLEAELGEDGRPLGWTMDVWSGPHGQRPGMSGGVNLLGAEAIASPPPRAKPVDVPDAVGGGALRNAIALYRFPQRVRSHFIPELPVRTSSLRGLGALGNVFAIECFMDEAAEAAGADPVAYRLSLLEDPRARKVIERAAAIGAWNGTTEDGRAKGFAFSRYKNHAAYLAVVIEVSVEEEVRLHRVWCAVDAGLVINPDGAKNQIEGGILQAASWVLHEEVGFAGGRPNTLSWDDYPILRFSEVPEIEIELIEAQEHAPLGVGEVALGPVAAAIGNAVARALGTRIRHLPFSRRRIAEMLLQ
jgi:nicotinate dehydrogenase subunit B